MRIRKSVAVAVVWGLSLVGVGLWAQGSQTGGVRPAPTIQTGQPVGSIITGENIGFQRVATSGDRAGQVTGRLVVKIDGVWKEIVAPIGIVR